MDVSIGFWRINNPHPKNEVILEDFNHTQSDKIKKLKKNREYIWFS